MDHVIGIGRDQITLFPDAIEDYINDDNPVRFIDAFVDQLDTEGLGFHHAFLSSTGRPPYHPGDLLKLYLYGYLNRIRSSRSLERETMRNLEVMWLLKKLSPDHKTISDFRRYNSKALKGVFREFIQMCRNLSLFGAELVAIDSTKFNAQNNRDRVKDKKGLEKSIEKINASITRYLQQLDDNDVREEKASKLVTKEELQRKIDYLRSQKQKMEQAKEELEKSGDKYISLTDPDCRLINSREGIRPSYSTHMAVDDKYSLIVDYEVTNEAADSDHLSTMADGAKEGLEVDELTVCADGGYYDTVDIKECVDNDVIPYVPVPAPRISNKKGVPQPEYCPDQFTYDSKTDTYTCPEGHVMRQARTNRKEDGRLIYHYSTDACGHCLVRSLCTTSSKGRAIHRWEHEEILDQLKERLKAEPEVMRRRKQVIEHVFGTIKKVWGYGDFLLRRLPNVTGEMALMVLAYNIRRVMTIIGTEDLLVYMQAS